MLDEILFRSIRGDSTPAEQAAVMAWRRALPENEARYRELERLLELARQGDRRGIPWAPPAATAILRETEKRRRWQTGPRRRRRWLAFGLAAAVPAAALLVLTLRNREPEFVFGPGEFATGGEETATVALGDGSVLRLAPNSRLHVRPSRSERVVSLEGRAYFAVAKVPGRPFRVQTRAGAVTVLGTRFDLQVGADRLELVVVEGGVALSASGQRATVRAGERSEVKNGRLSPPAKVADLAGSVAWAGNFLVFQREPLAEVATQLEQHYGVRVEIPDPVLANRMVTAWLSDQSLDEAINVVCTIVDADCLVRDSTVIVRPR